MSGKRSVSESTESNHSSKRRRVTVTHARGSVPIGPKGCDSKATIEKLADQYLALEQLCSLCETALMIREHVDVRGKELKRQIDKAVSGHKHKSQESIEDGLKRMGLSIGFLKDFDDDVIELNKAAEGIKDDRLRYIVLYYCRSIVENSFMLGNIARRDILDERRDRSNGRKAKLKQNPKTEERRLRVESKMSDVLRDDPDADWRAAWNRLYKDGVMRKLASRNTLEKEARAAYQKHFIEPPR
jgi:hypothetical protein